MAACRSTMELREVAFDPTYGRSMMACLDEDGIPAVEFRQGWVSMAPAVELERAILVAFSTLGVYSLSRNVVELYVLFGIGVLGFLLRLFRFPLAPVVLGLVLGPMIESEFRRTLIAGRGNWLSFVDGPISAIILILALLMVCLPLLGRLRRREPPGHDPKSRASG